MTNEKVFCRGCKQRIVIPSATQKLLSKGSENPIEFEDGYYCPKCAKIKVEKERSNF